MLTDSETKCRELLAQRIHNCRCGKGQMYRKGAAYIVKIATQSMFDRLRRFFMFDVL